MQDVIKEGAKTLIKQIRQYSRSQKESWRRVPLLALKADGRTGHSDHYSRAYYNGFWTLERKGRFNHPEVFVDLESGELIDADSATLSPYSGREITIIPAKDLGVLKLANNLDQLDATKVIDLLEVKAREEYIEGYNKEVKERWRADIKEILGLSELYTRRNNAT